MKKHSEKKLIAEKIFYPAMFLLANFSSLSLTFFKLLIFFISSPSIGLPFPEMCLMFFWSTSFTFQKIGLMFFPSNVFFRPP